MIPAAFGYTRARTGADAIDRLVRPPPGARLLARRPVVAAGLKLWKVTASLLVDLGELSELVGIRPDPDHPNFLLIGALTLHATLARSAEIRTHAGLLAQAASRIGDPQVRNRGTIGGALAAPTGASRSRCEHGGPTSSSTDRTAGAPSTPTPSIAVPAPPTCAPARCCAPYSCRWAATGRGPTKGSTPPRGRPGRRDDRRRGRAGRGDGRSGP
jgi:hypothetical protein